MVLSMRNNSHYENFICALLAWIGKPTPYSQDLPILRSHIGNCCSMQSDTGKDIFYL